MCSLFAEDIIASNIYILTANNLVLLSNIFANETTTAISKLLKKLQQMMKEQDQGLEMLGQSAERLSKISMGIHEELGHQNK